MLRFVKHLEEECRRLELEIGNELMSKSIDSNAAGPKPEHLVSNQERENNSNREDVSKIYFEYIVIGLKEVKLSIVKSNKNQMSEELHSLKSKLNLKLVQFEQASLEIRPFQRENVFEEINFITDDLKKHASDQILSQAIKLFGTVDFLGNPVGLISDVKDGFRDLVVKRDVQSFILNSMHGFSNSGAKISGTISDVVSALNQDSEHNARRAEIKSYGHNSGEHVQSGLTSLLIGFQGMTTSLYQSTKTGVQQRGVVGGVTGIAKGLAGTFTKPIAGMFDFSREIALCLTHFIS
jgi:vacuolar protein sorting-associated protein 13D